MQQPSVQKQGSIGVMKRPFPSACLLVIFSLGLMPVLFFTVTAFAFESGENDIVSSEIERLAGFKDHRQDEKIFDEERERGRVAYDELLEQQATQYKKDLEEYRKNKKKIIEPEETEDYEEHVAERKKELIEKEAIEEDYARKTKSVRQQLAKRSISDEEELGLKEDRPRIDYKKRMLYGAQSSFKALRKGGSSSSSGYSAPARNNPTFPNNDFSDTGFIPPPPPPEPFDPGGGDFTIPPPPPPDFGDDFPPPPPPPPPDFGDF